MKIYIIIAVISLTACSQGNDDPKLGPAHNYEVPDTLTHELIINK